MMNKNDLAEIRNWFERYIQTFMCNGDGINPLLQLKVDHTERVAREARSLALALGWSMSDRYAAEVLGILHDIGRFSQFAEYQTFADALSVDHGERGWTIVTENSLLADMPCETRDPILDGIRYHNKHVVPDDLTPRRRDFVNLIRDADKLDIFHVVIEAVERDGFRDLPRMIPGISLDRTVSPHVVSEIETSRSCSVNSVRTLGDFLLLQLSWIYDLNYTPTFQCVHDRAILERILQHVDSRARVEALVENMRRFVKANICQPMKGRE